MMNIPVKHPLQIHNKKNLFIGRILVLIRILKVVNVLFQFFFYIISKHPSQKTTLYQKTWFSRQNRSNISMRSSFYNPLSPHEAHRLRD